MRSQRVGSTLGKMSLTDNKQEESFNGAGGDNPGLL